MTAPLSPRAARLLAAAVVLGWLLFALAHLGDFGATWDCVLGEYPAGEQYLEYLWTGEPAWLDFSRDPENEVKDSVEGFGIASTLPLQAPASDTALPVLPRIEHRAPHLHYERWVYDWYESHPLGALLSAASCRVLWGRLALLPSLSAHNLPIVLLVAALLATLVGGAARRWGALAGLGAGLSLLLAPRFLTDAFNNLKDAPEAVLYTWSLLAWVWALRARGLSRWALAGVLTGLALAQKANALFLPLHAGLFLLLASLLRRRRGEERLPIPWVGVPLALLVALATEVLVSPMLWHDTLARLSVQVGYFLAQGRQSYVVQDWDGPRAFLCTTPPVLLLLAALGAANRRASAEQRLLLALGALFPVARTALPGAINFDGVRHFLEFMPFLALLAGLGLELVVREAGRRVAAGWQPGARAAGGVLLAAALLAPAAWACATTWPFGNCYWNAFAGGLQGAQMRGWKSATDYWAASYWQAFDWISRTAEPQAGVLVPVAWHVADAIQPLRLRGDIVLWSSPEAPSWGAPDVLYVAFVTNRPFYGPVAWMLEHEQAPVHEIRVQEAPILRIWRLDDPGLVRRVLDQWHTRSDPREAARRFREWNLMQPAAQGDRVEALLDELIAGDATAMNRLEELLPQRLHRDVALMLAAPERYWRR